MRLLGLGHHLQERGAARVGEIAGFGVGDAGPGLRRERGEVLPGIGELRHQRLQVLEEPARARAVASCRQDDREVVDELGLQLLGDGGAQQLGRLVCRAGLERRDRARVQIGDAHTTVVGWRGAPCSAPSRRYGATSRGFGASKRGAPGRPLACLHECHPPAP